MRLTGTGRRRGRPAGAFTIVEVLATLTLASIVLPAALHGILLCLATAGHARQQVRAAALAQSKLAEVVATGELYEAEVTGDFGEEAPGYTWVAQVADWETDARLLQVDVTVLWVRRGEQRHLTLTTLVYAGDSGE